MKRRLEGKKILVTRANEQASELTSLLQEQGAFVFEIPTIRIDPIPENLAELAKELDQVDRYAWLILTSVNTVTLVQELLEEKGRSWNIFESLQIACIGTATAERVQRVGGKVSLVPPLYQAEGLMEELVKAGVSNCEILLPRAQGSRDVLPAELSKRGAIVREIHIYRAEVPEESRIRLQQLLKGEEIDMITFTSSSTARNFVEMTESYLSEIDFAKIRIACIGPITADTLQQLGLRVSIQAHKFTIPGLVEAIVAAF